MERKNIWTGYTDLDLEIIHEQTERYKKCLDMAKTERECVKLAVQMAQEAGYIDIEEVLKQGKKLQSGDKVYACFKGKAVVLFCIGQEPISKGMNILGAHIDSPRIDIKQTPLYENSDMAYLDTHYYGGIKKYQWVTRPLAIHGVVAKKDGTVVEIVVGEKETDPVMVITDLLPHLSAKQMENKASAVIDGEKMDILVGNRPVTESEGLGPQEKDAVKANILRILKATYDIEEDDFLSAELELVPAGNARDCGLDRSMILAYGQDDRVCAFSCLFAMLEVKKPIKTTCCLLVDKEEIGSVGATGMHSRLFENTVAELVALNEGESELKVRRGLQNSRMLSADVNAAYDPMFSEVFEKRSDSFLGQGVVINKYTGTKGKKGSNDANAEYLAQIRKVFDNADVAYQVTEMGKVDVGGGGTISFIMATYGMEVIDCGVAILNMHAPCEVSSKADFYEAIKAYKAFLGIAE